MSEASRAARQRRINRLEELRAKYGHEDDWPVDRGPPADPPPTWGPIGTLARATNDPHSLAHLMALHDDLLQLERSGRGAAEEAPDMPNEAQTAPAEPIVEHKPPPAASRPRRRKKEEQPLVDLGEA